MRANRLRMNLEKTEVLWQLSSSGYGGSAVSSAPMDSVGAAEGLVTPKVNSTNTSEGGHNGSQIGTEKVVVIAGHILIRLPRFAVAK